MSKMEFLDPQEADKFKKYKVATVLRDTQDPKVFEIRQMYPKFLVLDPKFFGPKVFFIQKFFRPKNLLDPKFFGQILFGQKNGFGPNIFGDPKFFQIQNSFGPKTFLTKIFFGQNDLFYSNFFLSQYFQLSKLLKTPRNHGLTNSHTNTQLNLRFLNNSSHV